MAKEIGLPTRCKVSKPARFKPLKSQFQRTGQPLYHARFAVDDDNNDSSIAILSPTRAFVIL